MIRLPYFLFSIFVFVAAEQVFLTSSLGADTDGDGLLDLIDVPGFDPTVTEIPLRFFNYRGIEDLDGVSQLTGVFDLGLGNNHVTSIEEGDFTGLSNLRELGLGNNRITSVEPRDFSGLAKLRKLFLNSNELQSIEGASFFELPNLETLNLDDNRITTIGSDAFRVLGELEVLRLFGNSIEYIESGSFANKSNLHSLQLRMNDFTELNLQGAEFERLEPCQFRERGICVDEDRIMELWLDESKLSLRSFNSIIGELGAIEYTSLTGLAFTDEYPSDLSALLGIPTLRTVDVDQDLYDRYTDELVTFDLAGSQSVRVIAVGDLDRDGQVSTPDIDAMSIAAAKNRYHPIFDLNGDGEITLGDREIWVSELRHTYFGDANLDGEFNSGDLVAVFQVGEYETRRETGWTGGDWNGNGVFGSGDLVLAFQDGGYEQGPRQKLSTVPEPSNALLLVIATVFTVSATFRNVSRSVVSNNGLTEDGFKGSSTG